MDFSDEMTDKIRAGAERLEVAQDVFVEMAIDRMLRSLGMSPTEISEDE